MTVINTYGNNDDDGRRMDSAYVRVQKPSELRAEDGGRGITRSWVRNTSESRIGGVGGGG